MAAFDLGNYLQLVLVGISMGSIYVLIVFGVVFNRLNTTLLGWWQYARGGAVYIPSVNEVIITVTLVSLGVVAFGLAAKFLPLFSEEQHAPVAVKS